MRIEGALYTGLSGLMAHGGALSVVGDNVANFSTVGFKKQRADFSSLVADASSKLSTSSAGNGSFLSKVRSIFSDGTVEFTSRDLDFAIQGKGFFVVTDGERNFLTRAGNFTLDKDGFLVTNSGLRVIGYSGPGFNQLGPINLRAPDVPPVATTNANVVLNLNASEFISTGFPANPTRFSDLAEASSFSVSIPVINSLGAENQVSLFFAKTGINTWEVRGYIDSSKLGQPAGQPIFVGQGTLQFNTEGQLISNPIIPLNINWVGANPQTVELNFSGTTQLVTDSSLKIYSHNGEGIRGEVISIATEPNGKISLVFKNGSVYDAGYFALGLPDSLDDLTRVSENLYYSLGPLNLINPAEQKLGTSVMNSGLERSNVDLSEEFVNLIVYQKGFSANSKVITTANEVLDVGINLKR